MDYKNIYSSLLKSEVPLEIILNTIFILEHINQAYFISFKKYCRKHKNNIYDIVESITFICHDIKVLKIGDTAIILYHKDNNKIFDKVRLNNINNYLNHPKVYNNINYGIKYSLILNKVKIYKTASYNLKDDIEDFTANIKILKEKMGKILIQLEIVQSIELKLEEWYSKNFLINKLKTGLNLNQKQHLIKILNGSKFDKLSLHLSKNYELIDKYNSELVVILMYIKTHKILNKTIEISNWESLLIENLLT